MLEYLDDLKIQEIMYFRRNECQKPINCDYSTKDLNYHMRTEMKTPLAFG